MVVEELPECLIQLASITILATFQAPYTYIYIVCNSTNCHQGHLTRGHTLSYQKRKAIPTSAALIMNQRYWQILLCIAKVKGNWKRSIEANIYFLLLKGQEKGHCACIPTTAKMKVVGVIAIIELGIVCLITFWSPTLDSESCWAISPSSGSV